MIKVFYKTDAGKLDLTLWKKK